MASKRLDDIPGFSIDKVADQAGDDPDILRLENLDTDLRPPEQVIAATHLAIERDSGNSYLPFTGNTDLRKQIAGRISQQTGNYWHENQIVITNGGTEGMTNALLALTNPGEEVILTDPTYAGMIYRVKLTGAIPVLVPFKTKAGQWRLDLSLLKASITKSTRAIFIMNPSMPSGAVLNRQEWETIAELCRQHDLWLFYNAAMERILFDGKDYFHPASLPGMAQRTITIGSASKEFRMIGWRMGWVAAPENIAEALAKTHIYNVVTAGAFAQQALVEAFLPQAENSFKESLKTWEERRDMVTHQLKNYNMIPAAGGWSQILDVSPLGLSANQASQLLLTKGKVAVTPMTNWGNQNSSQFIRLVFSNESVERLSSLRERFFASFGR